VPLWSKKNSDVPTKFKSPKISPEELFNVAKRYVVQETVLPLKRVAKVLGIGLAGAVLFGLGSIIALVGVLRVLQTETGHVFDGNWSFAPYLLTAIVGAAVVALVAVVFTSSLRVPTDRAMVAIDE
jgi:hypothetical protein